MLYWTNTELWNLIDSCYDNRKDLADDLAISDSKKKCSVVFILFPNQ